MSLFTAEQLAGRVPDTGWRPPPVFPRLDAAKTIAVDLETKDPHLLTKGPGEIRGDGNIVGVAVGTDDGARWYFPMRHEFGSGNMNPEAVLSWCRDELSRANQPKIGANLMYDLSWLKAEGVDVAGRCIDVQYAEALLNENARTYALDVIAKQRLNEGKVTNLLYQWCADTYGGKPDRSQAKNIYRAPAMLVGPYAEGDVDLPLRIWEQQQKELDDQDLHDLFELESDLTPLLLKMRWHGVRVDLERANEVRDILTARQEEAQRRLDKAAGTRVDVWSADSIATVCERAGIEYLHTAAGAPSFTKPWLENHSSDLMLAVSSVRRYDKARGTFVDGYIFNNEVNGRIHAQFHPLRGDENGTVSGRFCVHGDTVLNTSRGDFKISAYVVQRGDTIKTHTGKQQRILRKFYKGRENMRTIVLDNGARITCTDAHRILTRDGWTHAGNITKGQEVLTSECEPCASKRPRTGNEHRPQLHSSARVKEIIPVGAHGVWDIEVEHDHSYCAHDFIHHNSSSAPNLQNIPSRDEELAPLIRSIFVPDIGDKQWRRYDFSQIEYRLLAHYAVGDGAEAARKLYCASPRTDYHQMTRELIHRITGTMLARKPTKNINFGLCIAEGQRVLTQRGLVRIENVLLSDKVWDGVEWVAHDGVVYKGEREVITYDGLTATSDHKVWTRDGTTKTLKEARNAKDRLARTGAGTDAVEFRHDCPVEKYDTTRWVHHDRRVLHSVRSCEGLLQRQSTAQEDNKLRLPAVSEILRRPISYTWSTIRRYGTAVLQRHAPQFEVLQRAWHQSIVRVTRTLYPMGTCEVPIVGLQESRLRPARQRRPLFTGERASCNAQREPVKQAKTYDIMNAGTLRRFTCEGVLVSNCYGMSPPTLAKNLNMTLQEAQPLFEAYHEGVPFVKRTYDQAMNIAKQRGYVRTILGRRRRFNLFESSKYVKGKQREMMPHTEAVERYGNHIQRAGAHAALNQILQGGSADMIKKAMRDAHNDGIFDVVGVPLVTVHDELDHSDSGSKEHAEAFNELQRIMETCIPLKVPVIADAEIGPNWGDLHEIAHA